MNTHHRRERETVPSDGSLALKHAFRQAWRLVALVTVSLLVIVAIFTEDRVSRGRDAVEQERQLHDLQCIAAWASAYTAYLKASWAYQNQIAKSPIPPPPEFTCLSDRISNN